MRVIVRLFSPGHLKQSLAAHENLLQVSSVFIVILAWLYCCFALLPYIALQCCNMLTSSAWLLWTNGIFVRH